MDVVAIQDDDDREDGEIVDDFEEISDCSIPSVGKCDNELLRAISLSSISDSADERPVHFVKEDSPRPQDPQLEDSERRTLQHRIPQYRKRKRKHRQHHDAKRRCSPQIIVDLVGNPTSSDEETAQVDKDTLRQLKEAVHIDNHSDYHHNSLRSRLKAMINEQPSSASDDEEIDTLRTLALLSNSKSELEKDGNDGEIGDDDIPEPELVDILDDRELLELRSAALKSAVLKKHQERKKRKEHVDNTEINKENTVNNDIAKEVDTNKLTVEKALESKGAEALISVQLQNNCEDKKDVSVEEDVDIMRAMLLASMSTKITTKTIATVIQNQLPQRQQPKKQLIAPKRNQKTLQIAKPTFTLPPVKPLIININNDSDSESDVKSPTKKPAEDLISQSVTEFLKLRRQQFEAKENGVAVVPPQSGNPPSNGAVLNTKIIANTKEIKLVAKEVVNSKENDIRRDLSGVKLLSKAQQREYQLLKRKLLLAKQKKLIEHIKSSEVKRVENATPKAPHTLKETLADLQFRENGRLRVKGKYDSLAGLLQLVNGASVERQQCETRMKRLLDELTTAKGQLGQSHRKFTILVQRLIRQKDNIDARSMKTAVKVPVLSAKPTTPTIPSFTVPITVPVTVVTSTPKKMPLKECKLKISDIISETNALVQENGTSDLVQDCNLVGDIGTTDSNKVSINPEDETDKLTDEIVKKDEVISTVLENSFETFPKVQGSIKYISPIDNRTSTTDPFGTLCPYELFGDCKDTSCKFVHCGKS